MPNCWIGNSSGGARVYLIGRYQPVPWPVAKNRQLKSDHQMISGPAGPGLTRTQRPGWSAGRLEIKLRCIQQSHLDGIQALYFAWESGRQALVQFDNSITRWLCEWNCDWDPQPRNFLKMVYDLDLELLIKEVVT